MTEPFALTPQPPATRRMSEPYRFSKGAFDVLDRLNYPGHRPVGDGREWSVAARLILFNSAKPFRNSFIAIQTPKGDGRFGVLLAADAGLDAMADFYDRLNVADPAIRLEFVTQTCWPRVS